MAALHRGTSAAWRERDRRSARRDPFSLALTDEHDAALGIDIVDRQAVSAQRGLVGLQRPGVASARDFLHSLDAFSCAAPRDER